MNMSTCSHIMVLMETKKNMVLKKIKTKTKKCSFHYFQIMRQNKWLEIQKSIKKGRKENSKENKPIREYYK